LKRSLIFVTVLALGGLAQAQGFGSRISLAAGIEGVFPGSTFTREEANLSNGLNAASQSTTNSVGGVGTVRFDFGEHSAFDFSVTFNRSSEVSEIISGGSGQFPTRVQSNNIEFIGTYVYRLPSTERFHPYFLVGGGMVHFRPLDDGFTTAGVPSSMTKGAFAYGFGPAIRWNLFDGGRVRANVQTQEALTEQALIGYEQTVLVALEEAESAMVAFVQENDRRSALQRSVAASVAATGLVKTLYRTGLTDFQNVLDTERTQFQEQDTLAQSEGSMVRNLIDVYRALGGGWSAQP